MFKVLFVFLLVLPLRFNASYDIKGQQPNTAVDPKGTIRIVYGEGESIYCLASYDKGLTFSKPELVAQVKDMHLGHSRGPQIASSKNYTVVTAISKDGTIHSYKLDHTKKTWSPSININDVTGSAPEGLLALTSDQDDNFYAVWLDTRSGNKNNIFFSSLNQKLGKWSKNSMIYKSPDEHVCECCKPNISVVNNKIAIGFRNWVMGARDIYYTVSTDGGKTFSSPAKSGTGTWMLNSCPMDGGGLVLDAKGKISTAWRRNGDVIYWSENQPEQKIGPGRDVSMAQNNNITVVAWQDNNIVKVIDLNKRTTRELGKGISPRVYLLPDNKVFCVWEDDKTIRYKAL